MDTLTFSGGTMLGLSLTVLFWLALPVTVFFLLRSRGRAQFFPVIAGAVTYFPAVRFNDLTAHLLLFRQPVGVQMTGIIGKGIDLNRYGIAHFTAARRSPC